MGKRIDLLNHRFGKLVVIENAGCFWPKPTVAIAIWRCKCDCGGEIIAKSRMLRRGRLLSCGCLREKHGHNRRGQRSKTYRAWVNIRSRCENPSVSSYKNYGARGISVCQRWQDFENFLADMGECPKDKSIERRDNNKNYEPENCYWADLKTQANNKRDSVYVTYLGETLPMGILAERHNIATNVLYHRIVRYGWSTQKAVTTPVRHRKPNRTKGSSDQGAPRPAIPSTGPAGS